MAISPRLVIEVFQHVNYSGRKITILDSVPNTEDIGAQDLISSIKIYKGPAFSAAPNYKAIFHEHVNYVGRRLVLAPGYYPNIHQIPYNFGDVISSISFSPAAHPTPPEYGAIPMIIEVYGEADYRGQKAVILRDVSDLKDIGINNSISPIRIQRGPNFPFSGCRAVCYEHPNFEGRRMVLPLNSREYKLELRNLNMAPQSFSNSISSLMYIPFDPLLILNRGG